MIFSLKLNPVQHPALFMNGTIIEETTNHTNVGLAFLKHMHLDIPR